MLAKMRRIHNPQTLDEAAELLGKPVKFPLYSTSSELVTTDDQAEGEGVDLTGLVSDQFHIDKAALWIGSRTTLESLSSARGELATVINVDVPDALRRAMTIGDVLMALDPDSLTLALLVGFKAQLFCHGSDDPITIEKWFELIPDERRQKIILSISFPEYHNGTWRLVVDKVPNTPDEKPVVAAIGFARGGSSVTSVMMFHFAVCGLAPFPIRYKPRDVSTLQSKIDDQRGSAQFRADTAKVIANRVIMQAVMLAQQGKQE